VISIDDPRADEPFGDYVPSPNSACLTLLLDGTA
jgi:hypothetical protein